MVFKSKYGNLRQNNPKLAEWHDYIYRNKSPKSADNMLRNICLFSERMNIQPDHILDLSQSGELEGIFEKFMKQMQTAHKMGSYIGKYKHAINSFLKYHHKGNAKKIQAEILNENKSSKYNGEKIPSKNDLQRVLEKATPRGRVIIALMSFSGLRPESIGNYRGNDGIKLKDLSGLDISDPNNIHFTDFPIKITIRDTQDPTTRLSKNGYSYWTLCGHQTESYIIDYLHERIEHGEKLSPESPLITHSHHGYGLQKHVTSQPDTEHVRREIRETMRKAHFNERPYTLRRFFMQTLSTGELKGYISMEWRLFLSGHRGNIQATYVSEKQNLNPELEKMVKESFIKCLQLLETEHHEHEDDKELLYSALLMTAHFSEDEIKDLNLNLLNDSDVVDLIRKRLSENLTRDSDMYVSVPEKELNQWAKKGYTFKGFSPQSGLCLMEKLGK